MTQFIYDVIFIIPIHFRCVFLFHSYIIPILIILLCPHSVLLFMSLFLCVLFIFIASVICLSNALLCDFNTFILNSGISVCSLWSCCKCLFNTECLSLFCSCCVCCFPLVNAFLLVSPIYIFSH